MTTTKMVISDLSPTSSIKTIYAAEAKHFHISPMQKTTIDAKSDASLARVKRSKPRPPRKGHAPVTKTTKTFEMRRKAAEAKAKELAEKSKGQVPLIKPTLKPFVERPIKTPSTLPAAVSSTARKIASTNPTRSTGGGVSKHSREILLPLDRSTPRTKTVEVQTCKSEIVNNMLIIGDAKVLRPSASVWTAILKKREEDLKHAMLKEVRKVPEYLQDEVNYQTNLKEFLETGSVKHYERKVAEKKPPNSRGDMFKRPFQKPNSQPEMDMKKRIKTIERELMGVFKGRA